MKQRLIQFKMTDKWTPSRLNEIMRIKHKSGLNAESLVDAARNKTNPLHELFEWNDSKAGELFRLQQARVFINEIKIVVENKEIFAFENVNVVFDGKQERQYMEVGEIISNTELRSQVIESAFNQLLYWKSKHEQYSEFKKVIKSIDELKEEFEKKEMI